MFLPRKILALGSWLHAGIALTSALSACSAPGDDDRLGVSRAAVRGGNEAHACEWPAVVALDLGCSGSLVHPELVVYAAHCGEGIREITFGAALDRPQRVVETRRCLAHPKAALGNGFDVAFCLLAEPVENVPPLRIAAGCELLDVHTGTSATVIGFGLEQDSDSFGIKRSAAITLGSIAPDLSVIADRTGSCAGDSGGPLVVDQPAAFDSDAPEQRLIGVVSAAKDAACGPTTDHYSYLPPLLPWLESASGRDLTPCFEADGTWNPTPRCTRSPSQRLSNGAVCSTAVSAAPLASTCGRAFSTSDSDLGGCTFATTTPADCRANACVVLAAGALILNARRSRRRNPRASTRATTHATGAL